jgi:hypothetical protein
MNFSRSLSLEKGIQIQQYQLLVWSEILNDNAIMKLIEKCELENQKLMEINCQDGFEVFRGSEMSDFLKNLAINLNRKNLENWENSYYDFL